LFNDAILRNGNPGFPGKKGDYSDSKEKGV
jgi:hypothetical protein